MHENALKGLRCVLYDNVLCSYRKNLRSGIMPQCYTCRHYKRFKRDRAEEEEEFFEEVKRARERLRRGELRRDVS